MIDALISDIDGTIAHHMDQRDIYDGSKVHLDEPDEVVIPVVLNAVWCDGLHPIFVTGRSEYAREATSRWVQVNLGLEPDQFTLLMRAEGDRRPSSHVKHELYMWYVQPNFDVQLVLEDRDRDVIGWRSLGLKTFQVAHGNF